MQFGAGDRHFNTVHEASNIRFGGGLDDVYQNSKTGQLHIVDYKSTAQGTRSPDKYERKPVSLDEPWKTGYKRQMDMYVWIMRRKGFEVSSTGYFLYCDGDRFSDYEFLRLDEAMMKFKMSLIAYEANTNWIEPTLMQIKECLFSDNMPEHHANCEHGQFLDAVGCI